MPILGYALTFSYGFLLLGLIFSVVWYRKEIGRAMKGRITRNSAIALFFIILLFVIFSALFVHPLEQLYFDENIYQGIAMNILKNGNSFWCQYGSAFLNQCGASVVYHDPVEWSFYIAIAFAVFGISGAVSYAVQMFAGVLLIIAVFLLGSALKDSRVGVLSALGIAVMPELMIWSRTQAVPDLAFAAFATLSFFFFVLFCEDKKSSRLLPLLFALGIAVYMRTEGALLIPMLAVLYFIYGTGSVRKNFRESVRWLRNFVDKDERSVLYLIMFTVLLVPQTYYLSGQLANPQFGQGSSGLFSVANFENNGPTNAAYFLGSYNSIGYYPAAFPPEFTALAVLGIVIAVVTAARNRRNLAILAVLGIWFLVYFFFYSFFYAGSATYGVDSRMMLQMHPQIAVFSAIGIVEIAGLLGGAGMPRHRKKSRRSGKIRLRNRLLSTAPYAAFIIIAAVVLVEFLPQTAILPANAPQQSVILPATNFIENNYTAVPQNCLVFSFTPDVWYELGRSSAQIGYLGSTNQSFIDFEKGYRCFVLDYGYWCLVPPFHGSTCSTDINTYNRSALDTQRIGNSGYNASFYLIRNYST